jgi:nitroimidazol reductase NimA-like FMN-containing flavoprotein (pyridoxamine 5'-phosphate oxidase superfamily)
MSMNGAAKLESTVGSVLRSQKLAVLATNRIDRPYTSLVAFAATADLKNLLFASDRATRKYANVMANPHVALLVDTRTNRAADFNSVVAVTAIGRAAEVGGPMRARFLKVYLAGHPSLEKFAKSPTCALMRVRVKHYYVVSRFQNVVELRVKQ